MTPMEERNCRENAICLFAQFVKQHNFESLGLLTIADCCFREIASRGHFEGRWEAKETHQKIRDISLLEKAK